MNKAFGFRGMLNPPSAFNGVDDDLVFDSIFVSVKNGVFEVGYDQEDEKERALKIANTLIASWSKRNNTRIEVDFNQTWKVKPDGNKFIAISLTEKIKVTDRVITNTVSIQGKAYIVNPHSDSSSFANDLEIAIKADKDETLVLALKYFHEEVVDHKRPMYGIHKAIEQIIKHLPGKNENEKRNNLAVIAGQTRQYIDDLMTSIQVQRHSEEWLKFKKIGKIIDDQECIARASNLIDAYTKSIT